MGPGPDGKTRRHLKGDGGPSLPPFHVTMTPRPTGRSAVRPRRLGGPGPSSCRRGSGTAPRRPLSFLQLPREALTGLRRWDSPAGKAASTLAAPVVQFPYASAQRLCVDSTRRYPHGAGQHGVSRASGEDAPGAAAVPPGSRWWDPNKRLIIGERPGPSAGVREEPRAGAQSWLGAVV